MGVVWDGDEVSSVVAALIVVVALADAETVGMLAELLMGSCDERERQVGVSVLYALRRVESSPCLGWPA